MTDVAPRIDPAEAQAEIAELFAARVTEGHAPGCFYSVFDGCGPLFEGGFGHATLGGPAPDRQTRFRIASCTKSFTIAALLTLRDAGRVQLDAPVSDLVPELRGRLPSGTPAVPTLRMLMSMAGGLPTDDPWADRQESLPGAAFLDLVGKGVRFSTIPGTRFEYSNLGYALLGQVIERVSGRAFPDFVAETLLRPLGLEMTTFDYRTVAPDRMATGYRPRDGDWVALPLSGPGAFSSIGGVISTGADLTRWAAWLCEAFRDDLAERGPLSAASRREMQAAYCPMKPEPDEDLLFKGYGFGLVAQSDIRHGLCVHHSGGYPGFSSHMRWNPAAGIGMVGFENATYSGAWKPVSAALKRLLDRVASGSAPPAPPPDVAALGGKVAALIADWDEALAAELCLENVALDRPFAERAAELGRLRARVGPPDPALAEVRPADGRLFGQFEVRVPCRTGMIIGDVALGPLEPARIQTLTFRVSTATPA